MSGGVQTKVLSPLVCAIAEGMHRTVEMHRRNSFVHFEDVLHYLEVLITGGAFIMNDDIITFCPIRIIVKWQWRIRTPVARPHHIHTNVSTLLDSFIENLMLLHIIMAAPTSNQESLERPGGFR